MDDLTLFGLVAVSAMLVFYALEDQSAWFILAFAGACGMVVEAIWAGLTIHRWRKRQPHWVWFRNRKSPDI